MGGTPPIHTLSWARNRPLPPQAPTAEASQGSSGSKTPWHKSDYSQNGGQCVEVRAARDGTDMRDTVNREAGHLTFPTNEWAVLLRAAR